MRVLTQLEPIFYPNHLISFAIGNYDGIHVGHQKIFQKMREKAGKDGKCVILTFLNHPIEFFYPKKKILKLTSTEYKLQLLKDLGMDAVILLKFNKHLANTSYSKFLDEIREILPFDFFFIGQGDAIGKNREGHFKNIQQYAKDHFFDPFEIPKYIESSTLISSNQIRHLILQGNLPEAEKKLSRPFGILLKDTMISLKDSTYQIQIPQDLCIPPNGKYEAIFLGKKILLTLNNYTLHFSLSKEFRPSVLSFIRSVF